MWPHGSPSADSPFSAFLPAFCAAASSCQSPLCIPPALPCRVSCQTYWGAKKWRSTKVPGAWGHLADALPHSELFLLAFPSLRRLISLDWSSLTMCYAGLGLVVQSCPALCDPMDCSPPGSSVREILQARILEWAATPSFRGSS